jgi:hypothetical protein
MNEEQYNSLIKKQLEEHEDAFFSDIAQNRERTWDLIEYRLEKKRIIPLWFYYAAASLILLLGIGFLFKQEINLKNTEIVQLDKKLVELENRTVNGTIKIVEKTDTVNIISEKIIYVQLIKHDTVVKFDTITKLLTRVDTVFIKDEASELIAENENPNTNNTVNHERTDETEPIKKRKNRRFIFRFGTPKNNLGNNVKHEPLISLKTDLK